MTRERVKDPEAVKKAEEEKKKQEKKEEKLKFQRKEEVVKNLVRVANTDIDGGKNLLTALQGIKGVSHSYANAVIKVSGFDPRKKLSDISESDIQKIEKILKNPSEHGIPQFILNRRREPETGKDTHLIGSDITVATKFDVQDEIDLKTYRGWRHMLGQPVRGQRTRSHFRQKGRVVGVLRKAVMLQMGKTGAVAAAPKPEAKKEEKK